MPAAAALTSACIHSGFYAFYFEKEIIKNCSYRLHYGLMRYAQRTPHPADGRKQGARASALPAGFVAGCVRLWFSSYGFIK